MTMSRSHSASTAEHGFTPDRGRRRSKTAKRSPTPARAHPPEQGLPPAAKAPRPARPKHRYRRSGSVNRDDWWCSNRQRGAACWFCPRGAVSSAAAPVSETAPASWEQKRAAAHPWGRSSTRVRGTVQALLPQDQASLARSRDDIPQGRPNGCGHLVAGASSDDVRLWGAEGHRPKRRECSQ